MQVTEQRVAEPLKDAAHTNPGEASPPEGAMPSIALPFAAFGAAAGLFAILAVGSFREAAREVSPFVPMLMTAGVSAMAGEALRRWPRLHEPLVAREVVVIWIAVIAGVAGMVSGGLVGLYTWGADGVARFAVGGAAVSLAFVPSCLVVFDAAKRAGRGRHGSLVAATDRRTVFSTVLAGIGFAGATQVPAILSFNTSNAMRPLLQVGLSFAVSLGSTMAILVLQRRDKKSRAALEAHAQQAAWLERAPSEEGMAVEANDAVDLGLGADRWTRGDSNYRMSGRQDVVLKGSVEQALVAFDECARRRHRSLLVAACGLSAVVVSFFLRMSVFL